MLYLGNRCLIMQSEALKQELAAAKPLRRCAAPEWLLELPSMLSPTRHDDFTCNGAGLRSGLASRGVGSERGRLCTSPNAGARVHAAQNGSVEKKKKKKEKKVEEPVEEVPAAAVEEEAPAKDKKKDKKEKKKGKKEAAEEAEQSEHGAVAAGAAGAAGTAQAGQKAQAGRGAVVTSLVPRSVALKQHLQQPAQPAKQPKTQRGACRLSTCSCCIQHCSCLSLLHLPEQRGLQPGVRANHAAMPARHLSALQQLSTRQRKCALQLLLPFCLSALLLTCLACLTGEPQPRRSPRS